MRWRLSTTSAALTIPYYDESTDSITMAYATEFTELEGHSAAFKSIQLSGYLAGALTKISLSLINNSQFDVGCMRVRSRKMKNDLHHMKKKKRA